jgi:hypothetical protein
MKLQIENISPSRGRRLVRFRNCFCGVQSIKFYDGQFLCQRHFESDRARYRQDPKVTEANIKECNARCEKERYARLKASGQCVTCGQRPNYFGCLRCEECQEKRRKLHYASRGKKLEGPHPWKIANQIFFTTNTFSASSDAPGEKGKDHE